MMMRMNTTLTQETPALRPYPSKIFIETTTRCNLQCPMCLKQSQNGEFSEGDMSPATFNALLPALSTAEAVVLNGIGEPLLHPSLEDFIRRAKERMGRGGWVGFQSNGQLMSCDRALSLVKAGVDRVCLSVDAVSPDTFRGIRPGGELAKVEQAIAVFNEARRGNGARPELGVEFVLRRDNIGELPETIRWAASRHADFIIVTHLFPYHPSLVSQAVYDANMDDSVSLMHKYAKAAGTEGVDIRRYHDIFMKYRKSAGERKIVSLVESMVAEASNRGISLNLQQLFSKDLAWTRKLEKIFFEAKCEAMQAGMRISLPEVVPRSARKCEFVEEGSVFVSWDGSVHPCYFLWHPCRCFVNGMEKEVKPKILGNLSQRGILEIWNDPAFVSFRQGVLRYDYPFCFNCSFALCDYVQGGNFDQDCHINAEPCGVCLWCMDIFRCLK